jgi:hypothetical protein
MENGDLDRRGVQCDLARQPESSQTRRDHVGISGKINFTATSISGETHFVKYELVELILSRQGAGKPAG